jgi:hypothetical protein
LGLAVFRNLIDASYQGILYPVNPKSRSIQGVKAYKTLTDISDEVEMAVLIVPSDRVEGVIEESAKKGVKGAIVITAGFKEIGGQGVELEKRVKATAKATDSATRAELPGRSQYQQRCPVNASLQAPCRSPATSLCIPIRAMCSGS